MWVYGEVSRDPTEVIPTVHELSITQDLVAAVTEQTDGAQVLAVNIQVGRLSGVGARRNAILLRAGVGTRACREIGRSGRACVRPVGAPTTPASGSSYRQATNTTMTTTTAVLTCKTMVGLETMGRPRQRPEQPAL